MREVNPSELNSGGPEQQTVPGWVYLLAALGVVVGAVSFGLALASDPGQAWRALLINFLYWTSLAQGAFVWAVIFRVARASWSAPVNRLGHAAVWFLGCSVVIFPALFLGRGGWLPWLNQELGDRAAWLDARFLFLRDEAGLLALFLLALAFVRTYLRGELSSSPEQRSQAGRRLSAQGVIFLLVYTAVSTLIALDLVMSLLPQWHGTLFGWYYSLGGLYTGMAALVVMSIGLRRCSGVTGRMGPSPLRDLGNLLLALAMAMTYFFFAQALTIWYANLPAEVSGVVPRLRPGPWRTLSWALLMVCYLGPFLLLVVREMKESPRALFGVASLVLAAMWYERYLLVAPSLAPGSPDSPAWVLLIGLGFLGMLALTAAAFLAKHPAVSALDLQLAEERDRWP